MMADLAPVVILPPEYVDGGGFEIIADETYECDGRAVRLREYAMTQSQNKRPGDGDRMGIAMHWRLAGYPADIVLHLYERRFYRVTVVGNG